MKRFIEMMNDAIVNETEVMFDITVGNFNQIRNVLVPVEMLIEANKFEIVSEQNNICFESNEIEYDTDDGCYCISCDGMEIYVCFD